ncbi:hypothetical protein RF819_02815 [Rhodoferax fermentans]|uniref:NrS-1 polymerase-like helicase domain-containing protein n=1 Tax=Rhodoferax fermentans TaxID=28066 RepID=A0A1T1ANS0_RHOFE|nr:hypothetical protein RF819_02815 [Rhodoferax fermentans]
MHCSSLKEFHAALIKHAAEGMCLLKGKLHKKLDRESRAGSTKSDDPTNWLCLDLDGAPYDTPQQFMAAIPEFKDVSHIVQYSASYGINGNKKLSCHIFMLLDQALPAANIKTWLMDKNLSDGLRKGITLSRIGATLHWPLDVTACQNDKLLYIAPPTLGKGVTSTLKASERIQYVPGRLQVLSVKHLQPKRTLEQVKEESKKLRDDLRKAANLPALRSGTKWVGELEIQSKPGVASITGRKEERGFVYFNLNGGDSWSYYHPVGNPEFIRCFKDPDLSYLTRELLPDYYKDQRITQRIQQSQPTEGGELVLAFRDKRTAQYWNGTWQEETQTLDLHPAKSELQLNHWMQGHQLPPFDVIPVWDMLFNPQSTVIIDEAAHTINTYVPTKYFRQEHNPKAALNDCPLIKRIMLHAISGGQEDETFEHWLNWLAVIFQQKVKPKTAWILHGEEGTGKGVIVSRVLTPLLGAQYVQQKRASELEEKFTGWLEKALIAFIDEIEVSASQRKDTISGDLRSFITEDVVTIRHMNRAAVQTTNYTGFIFSSNKTTPVVISSGDRRYNVGFFQKQRLQVTQNELDHTLPKELPAFMSYIMTREADVQTAGQALKNQAHKDLVEGNKTSADITAGQLANGDIMALWEMRMDLNLALQITGGNAGFAHMYHDIIKREVELLATSPNADTYKGRVSKSAKQDIVVTAESRLSRDELLVVFEHCVGNMPKTPNKFTSLLKHRGIKTEQLRVNGAKTFGLKVEWKAPRSWLDEVMQEIEEAKPRTSRAKIIKLSERRTA